MCVCVCVVLWMVLSDWSQWGRLLSAATVITGRSFLKQSLTSPWLFISCQIAGRVEWCTKASSVCRKSIIISQDYMDAPYTGYSPIHTEWYGNSILWLHMEILQGNVRQWIVLQGNVPQWRSPILYQVCCQGSVFNPGNAVEGALLGNSCPEANQHLWTEAVLSWTVTRNICVYC